MPRAVRKFTWLDFEALKLVRQIGFVRLDQGKPCLESNRQISPWRFQRLVAHGYLKPANDGLLGMESKTYEMVNDGPLERS